MLYHHSSQTPQRWGHRGCSAFLMYILAAAVAASPLRWLTEHCCQIFASRCFSLPAFPIPSLLSKQQNKKPVKHNTELGFFWSVTRLGSGLWGPSSAACQGTGKERAEA